MSPGSLRLISQLKDFSLKRTPPFNPPLRLWVDITSRCNLACKACPQRKLRDTGRRDMDSGLLESLASQVPALGSEVNLFHRGEPFLHPRLAHWVGRFTKGGNPVRIHTNACAINPESARKVVEAGPAIITCSIDSLDDSIYAKARPGGSLDQALSGLKMLLTARKELKADRPRINLLLMGKKRERELEAAKLAPLKNLGLDRVVFRRPHNWAGAMGAAAEKSRPLACTFPWYGLAVLSDGRVTPCPQDFFGNLILGHAGKSDLISIWQGEKARALRKAMIDRDVKGLDPCGDCDRIHRRAVFGLPVEHLGNFIRESILRR